MTPADAEHALADAEVAPCLEVPLRDAKELLEACLDADIPALLDRGDCCGKSGCGCAPKIQLLVRPDDVPRVAALLNERWEAMAEREGLELPYEHRAPATAPALAPADAAGENAPCPACGAAAPLVEGACSDCGLQLG